MAYLFDHLVTGFSITEIMLEIIVVPFRWVPPCSEPQVSDSLGLTLS